MWNEASNLYEKVFEILQKYLFDRYLIMSVGFSWVLTRTSSFKGIFVKYEYSHQYDLRIIAIRKINVYLTT